MKGEKMYHISDVDFVVSTTKDGKRVYGSKEASNRNYDPYKDILIRGDIDLRENQHKFCKESYIKGLSFDEYLAGYKEGDRYLAPYGKSRMSFPSGKFKLKFEDGGIVIDATESSSGEQDNRILYTTYDLGVGDKVETRGLCEKYYALIFRPNTELYYSKRSHIPGFRDTKTIKFEVLGDTILGIVRLGNGDYDGSFCNYDPVEQELRRW